MFRRVIVVLGLLAVVLVPLAARAQEEEAPRPYSYATYSECALSGQWRADEIAESVFAPAASYSRRSVRSQPMHGSVIDTP